VVEPSFTKAEEGEDHRTGGTSGKERAAPRHVPQRPCLTQEGVGGVRDAGQQALTDRATGHLHTTKPMRHDERKKAHDQAIIERGGTTGKPTSAVYGRAASFIGMNGGGP